MKFKSALLGICVCMAFALFSVPSYAVVASAGNYSAVTIGTSSTQVVKPAKAEGFLDIYNDSATATVCCMAGAAATITGTACAAGEITLPALWHRSWENNYVPTDPIYCISSAASTPLTIGVK